MEFNSGFKGLIKLNDAIVWQKNFVLGSYIQICAHLSLQCYRTKITKTFHEIQLAFRRA